MNVLEDDGKPILQITQGDRDYFIMRDCDGLSEKLRVITMMLFGIVTYLVIRLLMELFGYSNILKGEVGSVLLERPTDNSHGFTPQPPLEEVDSVDREAFDSGEAIKVEKTHVDFYPLIVPSLWYES